jgi:hypothetical protein
MGFTLRWEKRERKEASISLLSVDARALKKTYILMMKYSLVANC